MRRIASVFSSKRDKDLVQNAPLKTQPVASPTTSVLSTPQLSSGASSNGSTSLQTPEPEEPPKRSWKSWLSKSKTGTIKSKKPPETLRQLQPAPVLRPLPPAPARKTVPSDTEEDDEASDSESSTSDLGPSGTITVKSSANLSKSRQALQVIIRNSLRHRISLPPFIQLPDTPSYPRSCSSIRSFPRQETFQSSMHKSRLLKRLSNTGKPLTSAEQLSILPFAKYNPTLVKTDMPHADDEVAPSKLSQISPYSKGLQTWISRPCFEDRYLVWMRSEEGIICRSVQGTRLGVASLEFSEALEAMVDLAIEFTPPQHPFEESSTPEEGFTPSPSSSSSSLPHSRNSQYIATAPSPLRHEASPTAVQGESAPETAPPVKRGVRFAPDDKEDNIPIGYVQRIKKQREEKAKFLREQKERRIFEEEKLRADAERRERDRVRKEWEKERQAWEQEKRAMEEEKRLKLYQAEVTAARERREAQRMGGSLRGTLSSSSSTSLNHPERPQPDTRRYSRPAYDANRRYASEPGVASTSSSSPHSSSPSSSRPSSIVGHQHPPTNGAASLTSTSQRPASLHSNHSFSSSEDFAPRDPSKKRSSMASLSTGRQTIGDLTSPYAMQSSSSTSLHSYSIPPVPPVPIFPLDMPLLPPTAPFMLHQYPRPKSNSRTSSSPASSHSRHTPSNHSSERVNLQNSSPQRLPSSSPHRSQHQRRTSDDSRRNVHDDRGRSSQSVRSQPNSISRGTRSNAPSSYPQTTPSPWTAPPTQAQYLQFALSSSPNDVRVMPPRRQTTFS